MPPTSEPTPADVAAVANIIGEQPAPQPAPQPTPQPTATPVATPQAPPQAPPAPAEPSDPFAANIQTLLRPVN